MPGQTVAGEQRKAPKPVLVLLHGGGPGVDARSNWRTVRPRLSERFDCVAPDLLGFGSQVVLAAAEQDLPRGPTAWARARARQVLQLLDRMGLARVHVLGNSAAGGAAALALLATAPDRVEKTIVMGGAGTGPLPPRVPFYDDPTRDSMRAALGRLVADEHDHPDLLEELTGYRHAQALRPGAEVAFRAMFLPDAAEVPRLDLSTVDSPVLALHGERDRVAPVTVSERLVAALPQARLEVVEGAGHWIHVDRPDEFCGHVERFLAP
ncbi:alpha/beta fold hydrolase [Umezawaea endophytica]|uniref:Alpha/beta hydrolase n=1 Tax=Umezawaea endophytica TaxID=1654476 RepID=A0A9X2VIN4_9PSEU|nr:alpha/beta hydrolase [Umezawaea endophytica]MCS7476782.1 alpha/beta hydrolase [Umezawaea endophytica]